MLKLNLSPEPFWLEIGGGVRVKVPPLDTAILRAVEYTAWQAYAALKTTANGGDDAATIEAAQVARLEGAFALARVRALAGQIIAWEGVADEAGSSLIISPSSLDAFAAHPMAGPIFARRYDATIQPLLAEGNGSAPSVSGDGVAAIDTAPAASEVAADAAAAVPASATPRKAGKA